MESTLPHHESFTSADAYITSLLNFTASTPLFHQLVGGVHILDFFTSSPPLYDSILPESWRDYFETKSIDEILEILFRADLSTVHPEGIPDSLYEFAENVQRHELLREVVKNLGEVEDQHKLNRQRKLAQGMNNKKLHEVCPSTLLIFLPVYDFDFGSGQSYLSRILASPPHNLDLVAVESKASNIEAGKFLDERVGLTARSQGKTLKESLNGTETKKGSIKYVQHIIKDESMKEVLEALEQSEDEKKTENPGLMIISLHSCGNLIHHALNALIANDEVKAVAVVGCCYNLMTERTGPTYKPPYQKYIPAENTPIPSNCLNHHFPLSARLSSQSITLNITARMMAVQAPRNWTQTTSSDFFKRHFYRALLQRIFFEKGVLSATEPLIVGSLRKAAYMGFYEYVTSAVRKILNAASGDVGSSVGEGVKAKIKEVGLDNIGREEVESYERRYGKGLKELSIMWTLMAFCAGCVESLVVVDRWSYLKESGKCRIVKVEAAFEYGISPRNLVIVGVK
ncbi:hypothetical protein TWF679_011411 [Orbilia oligospora]|uniref:Methyltransferase domain-containing protein n=1 Tax=Orbilia oligospora TaxID=2813651 RepID=A0A8H8UY13_ORBOL|nr:hypothetical protein TWF679_011411 [Orbilia oligospora]